MSAAVTGRSAPILPTRDVSATIAFYSSLGFDVAGRYDAVGYLIMRNDDLELHFFRSNSLTARQNDHGCYFHADDATALRRSWESAHEWADRGFPRLTSIVETDYGKQEFSLLDPDGNLIRIGNPIAH